MLSKVDALGIGCQHRVPASGDLGDDFRRGGRANPAQNPFGVRVERELPRGVTAVCYTDPDDFDGLRPGGEAGDFLLQQLTGVVPRRDTESVARLVGPAPRNRCRCWRPEDSGGIVTEVDRLPHRVRDGVVEPGGEAVFATVARPGEPQPTFGGDATRGGVGHHVGPRLRRATQFVAGTIETDHVFGAVSREATVTVAELQRFRSARARADARCGLVAARCRRDRMDEGTDDFRPPKDSIPRTVTTRRRERSPDRSSVHPCCQHGIEADRIARLKGDDTAKREDRVEDIPDGSGERCRTRQDDRIGQRPPPANEAHPVGLKLRCPQFSRADHVERVPHHKRLLFGASRTAVREHASYRTESFGLDEQLGECRVPRVDSCDVEDDLCARRQLQHPGPRTQVADGVASPFDVRVRRYRNIGLDLDSIVLTHDPHEVGSGSNPVLVGSRRHGMESRRPVAPGLEVPQVTEEAVGIPGAIARPTRQFTIVECGVSSPSSGDEDPVAAVGEQLAGRHCWKTIVAGRARIVRVPSGETLTGMPFRVTIRTGALPGV